MSAQVKVGVVTGAANGIGAAIARRLHRDGYRVALVDLAEEPLRTLAAELGERATAHPMDVTRAADWRALTAAVDETHGPASLVVNNAGVTVVGPFAEQRLEDLDRIVDVNLKGVLYGSHAFLPQLTQTRGHIVNLSSLAGRVPLPYQSTYCATKFAVRGFSASLRMELAARGIGVTAVLPGTVATALLTRSTTYDATASSKLAELMLAYGVKPEYVADRVVTAVRRNYDEVLVGWDARMATTAQALVPTGMSVALRAAYRWRKGA